ncbi:MAG TPA: hypothetical protein VKP08_07455 [Anaerolineales bacterium]|nr:hypothetical protein [Anaerolineales bacterium]
MRRTFRRYIRKTLAQDIPPVLQEAIFAFDKGEYGRAGELFEQIAAKAGARGGPRAPTFYLQAGRARVFAGQTALGMPSLKSGLELFAQRGQFSRLQQAGTRIITELNEHGLTNEAAEIEDLLKKSLPTAPLSAQSPKRPALPTRCPACGATLRPDEVEWLDEVTAECDYCGSPVRSES